MTSEAHLEKKKLSIVFFCEGVTFFLVNNFKKMKRCAGPLTKEEAEKKIGKEEQEKALAEETEAHKEEAKPCEKFVVFFSLFHFLVLMNVHMM